MHVANSKSAVLDFADINAYCTVLSNAVTRACMCGTYLSIHLGEQFIASGPEITSLCTLHFFFSQSTILGGLPAKPSSFVEPSPRGRPRADINSILDGMEYMLWAGMPYRSLDCSHFGWTRPPYKNEELKESSKSPPGRREERGRNSARTLPGQNRQTTDGWS